MSEKEDLVFGDMKIEAKTVSASSITPAYGFNCLAAKGYEHFNVMDKVVCSSNNQEGEVISTCGEFAWVKFEGYDAPETRHVSLLSKPKTAEGLSGVSNDDWPRVGSFASWGGGSYTGVIKAMENGMAWIQDDLGNYVTEYIEDLEQTKSSEEELRDELHAHFEKYTFVDQAINELPLKYSITKKDK